MSLSKRERNIALYIFLIASAPLLIFNYPFALGADSSIITGSGQIVFMEYTSPETVNIGDFVVINYPLENSDDLEMVGKVTDISEDESLISVDFEGIDDSQQVELDNIVMKDRFKIPLLGYLITVLKTLPGMIFFLFLPLSLVIYYEMSVIFNEYQETSKDNLRLD